VPSNKSGVLVTANLVEANQPGLTVSTALGVGGAVAGEAAESVIIRPDATTLLVSEAKTPYQRQLAAAGGVEWLPAASGPVLNREEIRQLITLAAEVNAKYAPVHDETGRQRPWDIEFGFVDGQLTLFQIRPLVQRKTERADRAFELLRPAPTTRQTQRVSVDLTAAAGGT